MNNNQEATILNYLIREEKQEPEVATILFKKVTKYEDIKQDFLRWLENRNFSKSNIEVNGYTAEQIAKLAPHLRGIGVYNFLTDLRDNPEIAKSIIAEKFITR